MEIIKKPDFVNSNFCNSGCKKLEDGCSAYCSSDIYCPDSPTCSKDN